MKIRLNRLPRHANFEYRPRYYDPERERREALAADYAGDDPTRRLKSQIRQGFGRASGASSQFAFRTQRNQQSAASNRRLFLIIALFMVIAYLLLESNVEGLLQAVNQLEAQ